MRRPSLNHAYRVIRNPRTGANVVVSELARTRGKATGGCLVLAAVCVGFSAGVQADGLPVGGQVSAGQGQITQSGNVMRIEQGSDRLAVDWQSFSIGQGNTVTFVQPASTSVALNRVTGSDVSVIQGALKANGQVFLVNPNGVVFTPTAQVDVGGLVATTLNQSDADFMAGRDRFTGSSVASVINQGSIIAADGGYVALIAAKVENTGTLVADKGTVALAAGSDVTLDLGLPARIRIDAGALDAQVTNGGAIRADGGTVLLSASAADELLGSAINNSGVIRAQTLASGEDGTILLLGDMQYGSLEVGGVLDASAPDGGNGGFIETSAAQVRTAADLVVNARAEIGQGGTWLIDPYDYVIDSAAAGNIVSALNTGTSVSVTTSVANTAYGAQASGSGDITVASAITKTAGGDATLTLTAARNILVSSDISSSSGALNIVLSANNALGTYGGVNLNGSLISNGGDIHIGGAAGSVSNGIGYASNLDASNAAVLIQQGKSINSAGGDIVINGTSSLTSGGSYSGTKAGIYVRSDASVNSGGGNIFMSGISTANAKVFGVAVEGNSGTLTTFTTSGSSGTIVVDAWNSLDTNGALGLLNNGNQARVRFDAPSVAHMLFKINGSSQMTSFTMSPPCGTAYPNCGTLLVPGSNGSYLYATYQAVKMATHATYVFTGDASKTYDGTTTASGLSITTLGAQSGFSTGSLAFQTSSKNAGTYSELIGDVSNPDIYSSSGTDYAVAYFYGTYTVSPKTLTPVAADKQYDGTTAASVTSSGVVAGDSVNFNYTSGTFASSDVGTGIGVNVSGISLSGVDAGNYAINSTSLSTTADITARVLNLTGSRVYDNGTNINASILNLGNLVPVEDLVLSGLGSVADKNAATGKALTLGTLALADGVTGKSSNYTLVGGTHAVDVTPASLTVSGLSAEDKVYDGNTTATLSGTAVLSGLLGVDSVSVDGGAGLSGTFSDKNVGTGKSVSASLSGISLTGSDAGNYQVTGFASALTAAITPATLTVSGLSAQDKVYDGNNTALISGTATLSGLIGADSVTLSGTAPASGNFADRNVGTGKTVTASLSGYSLSGSDAGNYQIGGLNSALSASITPASLTVSGLGAQDKIYDGNTIAAISGTASLSGLIGTDSVTLSGTAPASGDFSDRNAGSGKVVSVSLSGYSLSGSDSGNYQISGLSSVLSASITPASLVVSGLSAQDKVYDGNTTATLTGTAVLSGVLGADSVGVNGGAGLSGVFSDKNVGTDKSVSASLSGISLIGSDAGNYQVTGFSSPLAASITSASLTVSGLSAQDKVYDGNTIATLTGTVVLSGILGADSVGVNSGAGLSGVFSDKNVGTGKSVSALLSGIRLTGDDAANYQVTAVTSPLIAAITPATVTVSGLSAQDKAYDGTTTATLTGTAVLSGLIGADSVTLSGTAPGSGEFENRNVGTDKLVTASLNRLGLSGSDAGNYRLGGTTSRMTASITPATLTVSGLGVQDKVYDGSTSATLTGNAVLSGVLGTDVVSLAGRTGIAAFDSAESGTDKIVTVALESLTLSGVDAGNYRIGGLSASLKGSISRASSTTDASQFLPKTVQVEQFLGNAANLPVSMPPSGVPDGLNYVPVTDATVTTAAVSESGNTQAEGAGEASQVAGLDARRDNDGLKATNIYVVTTGINLSR